MNITKKEQEDAIKVDEVATLSLNLTQQNLQFAAEILIQVINNTPKTYKYLFVDNNKLFVKSWDKFDFINFSTKYEDRDKFDEIVWMLSAYPRAHYYMGIVLSKYNQLNSALQMYKKGMSLEPTNPHFLIGAGNVFSKMKNHVQAIEFYKLVGDVSPYISPRIKALALRSEGVQLIEMNELENAKLALLKSLDIEPNNQNAINELLYIDQLNISSNISKAALDTQLNLPKNKCMYCNNEFKEGELKIVRGVYYYVCKNCSIKY